MLKIVIEIWGPSLQVGVRWDGVEQGLICLGSRHVTEFGTNPGTHEYIITVLGAPDAAWIASVRRAESPSGRDHEGTIGPSGQGTTGRQVFDA
jgi:hypothetical protein